MKLLPALQPIALEKLAKLSPEEILAAYNSGAITQKELVLLDRTLERERCKSDLFYLAHDVLGYGDLTESIHRPLCDVVSSANSLIIQLARQASESKAERDVKRLEAEHDRNVREWEEKFGKGNRGYPTPSNFTLAPTQNFKTFSIPSIESINNLRNSKIIQFNPQARTRLFLLFRGAFKSTIITIAHTIQLMLIWPDIRILIASHKKEGGSQKFLGSIKDHFIRNDRFRTLFPEYCPKPGATGQIDWGTSEQVTLPNRSKRAIFPEATIEIAGNTTDVTGRHYNYLKIDDIVTRESVTNESMLAKTEEFNALLTFLFDQPEWGIADYAGTCYHFADLYAQLRESDQITKFILPIIDENGNPTVPERFTKDGIEAIRNHPSMTSYQFSAQYMMNPVPEEDQTFRPDWWKRPGFYYDEEPQNLRYYVFVDPAAKQKKDSDYTALITIGVDQEKRLYLVDIIRDKLDESGRAKLVFDICKKRGLHKVHYEAIGFQSTDAYIIKKLAAENQYYLTVEEIKATKISKEDRIRSLQPIYERGDIRWPRKYEYYSKYHRRTIDMVDVLKKEMWLFPKSEHDDVVDCHSFCTKVNMYGAEAKAEVKQDDMFNWFRQLAIDAKKPNTYKPMTGNKHRNNELPYRRSWR